MSLSIPLNFSAHLASLSFSFVNCSSQTTCLHRLQIFVWLSTHFMHAFCIVEETRSDSCLIWVGIATAYLLRTSAQASRNVVCVCAVSTVYSFLEMLCHIHLMNMLYYVMPQSYFALFVSYCWFSIFFWRILVNRTFWCCSLFLKSSNVTFLPLKPAVFGVYVSQPFQLMYL